MMQEIKARIVKIVKNLFWRRVREREKRRKERPHTTLIVDVDEREMRDKRKTLSEERFRRENELVDLVQVFGDWEEIENH